MVKKVDIAITSQAEIFIYWGANPNPASQMRCLIPAQVWYHIAQTEKIKINFTTQDSNKELTKFNQYCPKAREANQNKMRANDNINPIPVIL